MSFPRLSHPFLQLYMEYVEDTETPRVMHLWAALTGIGASLGRRVFFPWGIDDIYPNLYTLLVGPPATRKNTAISYVKKRLKYATNVRFTPDDTGGQRQGLIVAIEGKNNGINQEMEEILDAAVAALDISKIENLQVSIDTRDKHVLMAVATEITSLIGRNAMDMYTFLNKMYDGEEYGYEIRSTKYKLGDALLTILGATTPSDLAHALPPEAIGHGFTSRIIFVYANKKYKRVSRPRRPDPKLQSEVNEFFRYFAQRGEGPIANTAKADRALDELYDIPAKINDPRFIYYVDRRQTHLIKTAIILAVARRSKVIESEDVRSAHELLEYTEQSMPEAFGEYGLSKTASAKQKLLEFLHHVNGPVEEDVLWAMMQRDLQRVDFYNCLMDLTNTGKIHLVTNERRGKAYVYNYKEMVELEEALAELIEEDESTRESIVKFGGQ